MYHIKGQIMKKRYIFGAIVLFIVVLFLASVLGGLDSKEDEFERALIPRIGQKIWTYNMNKKEWRNHSENDLDDSKNEIILQVQEPEGSGGYTSYHLLTGNAQVPKEDVWVGEGSQEFLRGKNLYSYYPKSFEFYQIIFNGVKFVPHKLTEEQIAEIFKGYNLIKVSELKKGDYSLKFSRFDNKFIILNDVGEDFYKYYVVPNDSKKLQIEEFSNQFKISDKVEVKLQRLEGCSKVYPCYEIKFN